MVTATPTILDSRDFLTPSRHVFMQLGRYDTAAQELSALIHRISLAGKMIARSLSQAGLVADTLGVTGEVNVQGEVQQRMDAYADRAFISALRQSGLVCKIVSEEMTAPAQLAENCPLSRLALFIDPLDGSSNIDVNLAVGSIFSVVEAQGADHGHNEDLLRPGTEQKVAGYILYGTSTQMVLSIGSGVHCYTLDPSIGEFLLTASTLKIPQRGTIYSVNEGYYCQWLGGIQEYIRFVHRHEGYTTRYSGALVSDFHRVLLQGGVYLYPGTIAKPEGKLRLMYEANPLAFLVQQAGGVATTGSQAILDIEPQALHQRVPLIIGSPDNVAEVLSCTAVNTAPQC
ncbi:MAG: class 1 fructose-bisphosphatase [Synechococcales cyanobacterium]